MCWLAVAQVSAPRTGHREIDRLYGARTWGTGQRCFGPYHHYNGTMAARECYHCKQWVEEGEEHDCWTTTEAALTQDLSEHLQDAWERLAAR